MTNTAAIICYSKSTIIMCTSTCRRVFSSRPFSISFSLEKCCFIFFILFIFTSQSSAASLYLSGELFQWTLWAFALWFDFDFIMNKKNETKRNREIYTIHTQAADRENERKIRSKKEIKRIRVEWREREKRKRLKSLSISWKPLNKFELIKIKKLSFFFLPHPTQSTHFRLAMPPFSVVLTVCCHFHTMLIVARADHIVASLSLFFSLSLSFCVCLRL